MYEKLYSLVIEYYKDGTHGFSHVERVYNISKKIAEKMNVDIEMVEAMALLHDIARYLEDEDKTICHAAKGAEMARGILEKINYPKTKIETVCDAIAKHRYSKGLIPESVEGKILVDADRLESIGALAIGRIFYFGGQFQEKIYDSKDENSKNTTIGQFYKKNLKIKPETFYTKEAQKIAKSRSEYLQEFVKRYIKEYNGEL